MVKIYFDESAYFSRHYKTPYYLLFALNVEYFLIIPSKLISAPTPHPAPELIYYFKVLL